MNIKEAAERMGMKPASVSNYLKRRVPALKHDYAVVNGSRMVEISEEDFTAWKKKMDSRTPSGSRLHKSRVK